MRARRWTVVVLVLAVVAPLQTFSPTSDSDRQLTPRTADAGVSQRPASSVDRTTSKDGFTDVPRKEDRHRARFGKAADESDLRRRPLTATPSDPNNVDPETLVVHFEEDVGPETMAAAVRAAGVTPVSTIAALGSIVVSLDGGERREAIARLERDGNVENVESNRLRYLMVDANDEFYYEQLHILVSRLPVAWEVTKGSTNLDIAILDTGVDLDHPDLDDRIVAGRDIVNNDAVSQDEDGHGTMVAGIAAAETNNGIGVAGAAWNARIMPVKVLDASGGFDSDIASGIVWAVDHGAEVINLSLGGPDPSTLLSDAVAYATAHNVIVVAAAGNEGTSEPSYPAAIPDVVAVGATDLNGDLVSFSNHGPWIDLAAPGTDIVSTALAQRGYAIGDGTSFSSPIVAGVALLVRAKNPSWTPAQIAARLTSSASDRGPDGIDDSYGHGLLDAYAAVGGRTAGSPNVHPGDWPGGNDLPDGAFTLGSISIGESLFPEGDTDWFAVDVAEPGSLTAKVIPSLPVGLIGIDPIIEIFSADLRSVGMVNGSGTTGVETITVPVPEAGRYLIRVSNRVGSSDIQALLDHCDDLDRRDRSRPAGRATLGPRKHAGRSRGGVRGIGRPQRDVRTRSRSTVGQHEDHQAARRRDGCRRAGFAVVRRPRSRDHA